MKRARDISSPYSVPKPGESYFPKTKEQIKRELILSLIDHEFRVASESHPKFNSYHEGYAILKEEVDELWDEVKASSGDKTEKEIKNNLLKEAVQVGAMAMRFIIDLCEVDDLL